MFLEDEHETGASQKMAHSLIGSRLMRVQDRHTKFISVNISKVANHESLAPQKFSTIQYEGKYFTGSLYTTRPLMVLGKTGTVCTSLQVRVP